MIGEKPVLKVDIFSLLIYENIGISTSFKYLLKPMLKFAGTILNEKNYHH